MDYSEWGTHELERKLKWFEETYEHDRAHFEDEMLSAGAPYMAEVCQAHLEGLLAVIEELQIEILWREHDTIEGKAE